MRILAAAARQPSKPHHLLIALNHLFCTTTTATASCSFDPTAQFLPSDHHRGLSLPTSLRRDALLALVRLLKVSPQCHLSLHLLCPCSGDPPPSAPLAARFAAAFRLSESAPALRPFAAIILAALLPNGSPYLLSWSNSAIGSARVRYGVLRLALHAFLAAGMPAEALEVLARVRRSGHMPSLSALAILLRLLFRSGEVQAAWKVFEEMVAKGPRPSLAIFNAMILGFCHRGMIRVGSGLLGVMGKFRVVPDACSFNILIKGHCVFGWAHDMHRALNLMNQMLADGCMVLDELVAMGCTPNSVTYNTLMDGICSDVIDRAMILTGRDEADRSSLLHTAIVQLANGGMLVLV
ncbi:hypothetical protein EJB05_23003, partial [Eragrostis curvula]